MQESFLDAIRADPKDVALRLVYADWLQEQGDQRGDLVRIEEEMRQLPVFSDRFWQLKRVRNDLRARMPEEWLETMGYGSECRPIFRHGLPDGWKERWRLIREFTEQWHGIPLPDVGGYEEIFRVTEKRLGRKLPPSVREWLAFAQDVGAAAGGHPEVLRDGFPQIEELEGFSAVSLLLQAEGDVHWAIRHEELALADPPVLGFYLDYEDGTFVPVESNPVASAVTLFALEYVISYTHGQPGGYGVQVHEPARLRRHLGQRVPVCCQFDRTTLFEAENILIRIDQPGPESGAYLNVKLAKPMPRATLVALLGESILP
jgi:uncharacterized protein (TIGR02996 family)